MPRESCRVSKTESASSVFRPAFLLTGGRVLGFVVAFATPIVLVRIFSQTEFGTYKQLFLIYGTLFSFAQFGMVASLYYFIPGAARSGAGYVLNALAVLAASGIACFALLWWNATRIAAWLNNPALAQYIPYIGAFFLVMLVAVVLETVMIARKQHRLAFWAYALSSTGQALLIVVPTLIFRSLQALLIGVLAFSALRLLITFVYLSRQFPEKPRFETGRWKAHLAYALPYGLAVALQVVQTKVHFYAVSTQFDAATFAIYAVGCLQVPLVGFLAASTGNVLMVKMRENIVAGKSAASLPLWRDTTRKLMLVFAPLAAVLIVTAHALIVTLYTSRYAASVPIFEVWAGALILPPLLTNCVMRVYAQTRFLVLLKLVKLAVVILVIGFLMKHLGLVGAVTATVIAMVAGQTLALWRGKVVMRCTLGQLLPWKELGFTVAIAGIAALPALAVRFLTQLPAIAEMFLIPSVYFAAYGGLLWFYGPILPGEKRLIVRTAQRYTLRLFGRGVHEF